MRIVLVFLLMVLAPFALADSPDSSVFNVPNMDQSMMFLSEVFGQVGSVIGGATNGPLEQVILLFNNIALVIGGFVILYAITVSTVNTAHDGELLGKKWSSVWIPLRAAIGFALLLPVKAGGYAIVQVIIMWIVVQGIGAADYIWGQYLKSVETGNATPQNPYISQDVMPSFIQIFTNAACTYALSAAYNQNNAGVSGVAMSTPAITYPGIDGASGSNIEFGISQPAKPSICGLVAINPVPPEPNGSNAGNLSSSVGYLHPVNTVTDISSIDSAYGYNRAVKSNEILISATQQLVQAADYYVNSSNYCTKQGTDKNGNPYGPNSDKYCINQVQRQIINAANNFSSQTSATASSPIAKKWFSGNGTVGNAIGQADQADASGASVAILQDLNQARQYGWLYAGTYYILLSKITAESTPNVSAPKVSQPTLTQIPEYASSQQYASISQITQVCNNPNFAVNNVAKSNSNLSAGIYPCIPKNLNTGGPAQTLNVTYTSNSGTGILSPLIGVINSFFVDIFNDFLQVITSASSNPVVALATLGQSIVVGVSTTYLMLGTVLGVINGATGWIPLVGSDVSSTIQIEEMLFDIPVMGLLGMTMGFAAMVGYYLPLVPYILFTAGALTWIVLVIEAMVAGPILALGIVHPEGQHDVWGRSEKGVMLLLSTFLRPMLMIIGFIAASLLVYVAFQMLNGGYKVAISFLGALTFGPFVMFFTMIIYFSIATYLMQQSFKLIHRIPDQVLRWIGETPENTGQEADQEVTQGGQKVSGQGDGAGKAMTESRNNDRSRAQQAKAMEAAMSSALAKRDANKPASKV